MEPSYNNLHRLRDQFIFEKCGAGKDGKIKLVQQTDPFNKQL